MVPYNPWLLLMFDSHINVEMCSTVKACKYIFKYIFKVPFIAVFIVMIPHQGFDKTLVEFIEQSRVSNGRSKGAPGPIVAGGKRLILPKGAKVAPVKLKAMEREAKRRLQEANVPL